MKYMPMRYIAKKENEYSIYSVMTHFEINKIKDSQFMTVSDRVVLIMKHIPSGEKFKINTTSIYSVIQGFKTVLDWFYDKDKNDMFVIGEAGNLIFNNDYNNLSVSISSYDNQHLEILPCVNNKKNDRGVEGVCIFVNRYEASMILTRKELEEVYVLLSTFSFQTEALYLLTADMIAVKGNL